MTVNYTITIENAQVINGIEYTQEQLARGLAQVRTQHNERTKESLTDEQFILWANKQNLVAWYEQNKALKAVEPSPVASEINRPDWASFMQAMDTQGLFVTGLAANFPVFTQIFNMLLAMRDKQALAADDCIEYRNFKLVYSLGREAFSDAQLSQVEAAMAAANIPLIE